jgi:hypothetical protein
MQSCNSLQTSARTRDPGLARAGLARERQARRRQTGMAAATQPAPQRYNMQRRNGYSVRNTHQHWDMGISPCLACAQGSCMLQLAQGGGPALPRFGGTTLRGATHVDILTNRQRYIITYMLRNVPYSSPIALLFFVICDCFLPKIANLRFLPVYSQNGVKGVDYCTGRSCGCVDSCGGAGSIRAAIQPGRRAFRVPHGQAHVNAH